MKTLLKIAEPSVLAISFMLLALTVISDLENIALLSVLIIAFSMVPFFLRFEHAKPKPRDIVPIAVMSVIAALGRVLFNFIPGFQPVTAIVIVTGIIFGPQSGFLAGALAAFTSNMFLGHGPWTLWQMLGWALAGYAAGLLARTSLFNKKILIYIYGFAISVLYGWFLNLWVLAGYIRPLTWQAVLSVYAASLYPDMAHAVSTVLFLAFTLVPWRRKLERLKIKYGIVNSDISG